MWSATRKKLESFLCDSLKDRIDYYFTGYRKAHDQLGRACIIVDKKVIVNCSAVEFDYKCLNDSRYKRGLYDGCKERSFTWWTAEDTLTSNKIYSIEAFFEAVGFLFDNPISESIGHFNDIVVCMALIDRRVGKRTLAQIKNQIDCRSDLVNYFYRLRCSSEYI